MLAQEKIPARSSIPLDRDNPASVPAIHQQLCIPGRPQAEPLRGGVCRGRARACPGMQGWMMNGAELLGGIVVERAVESARSSSLSASGASASGAPTWRSSLTTDAVRVQAFRPVYFLLHARAASRSSALQQALGRVELCETESINRKMKGAKRVGGRGAGQTFRQNPHV